ncbi:conserved hypothetical protein [Pelodictyon luteolum DSM 273]|uniref:DUF4395 domain-containing protein n=2 Tax=Pelodictyon luteolum TaxID=1100 RepID=Q3B2M8_CHLL3|nr:conserved hypothetical protein [Pelodictyon luteolum DSM 273]
MPIVTLNRAILLAGVILAGAFQQPLITTALFLIILPAVLAGKKASMVFILGSRLFASSIEGAATESAKLMRFNNAIAAILLGGAQVAFLAGATMAGWVLSGIVALAAGIALCGFCFGCFLFYRFNLERHKLSMKLNRQL